MGKHRIPVKLGEAQQELLSTARDEIVENMSTERMRDVLCALATKQPDVFDYVVGEVLAGLCSVCKSRPVAIGTMCGVCFEKS